MRVVALLLYRCAGIGNKVVQLPQYSLRHKDTRIEEPLLVNFYIQVLKYQCMMSVTFSLR